MNSIFMSMSDGQVLEYVNKLKLYGKQPYNLDAVKLSQFVKIKTELLKIGISFNMSDLDKSDTELANIILTKIVDMQKMQEKIISDMDEIENELCDDDVIINSDSQNIEERVNNESDIDSGSDAVRSFSDIEKSISSLSGNGCSTIHKNINGMLNVDINSFDEERAVLRDAIFNKTIVVKIQKAGKNFQMKWNISMTELVLRVPSNWEVDVDHTLLLDLHTKEFGKTDNANQVSNNDVCINTEKDVVMVDDDDVETDELQDENCGDTNMNVEDINITSKDGDMYDSTKIISMFKEMKDYPKIRHTLKRKIGISYKDATALIKNALLNATPDELVEMGIDVNSRLYKQLTR